MTTTNETTVLTTGYVERFLSFAVIDLDERQHTDDYPFCSDPECPCHDDSDLVQQCITARLDSGELTRAEAIDCFFGNLSRYYMRPCEDCDLDCWNVYDRQRTNADGSPYCVDSHLHGEEARALIAQEAAKDEHTVPFVALDGDDVLMCE